MENNRELLISAKNLVKWFPVKKWFFEKQRYVKAVDDVNVEIYKGETVGVVGESGCGKSTMVRTLLRLLEPTSGEIIYKDQNLCELKKRDMRKLRKQMQIVFQDPYKSLHPRMRVGKSIEAPLVINRMFKGKGERKARALELMEKVGLNPEQYDRFPHEFSGGQRQRIVIARALAMNPELVICDEPVSALDVSVRAQVLNLLKKLQQDMGLTYIFISHDLSVVRHVCDRIYIMYLGKVVESGTTEEIFNNPQHPYTRALLSATPDYNDPHKERIILEGDIPSPVDPPSGCRFHTRCAYATERCSQAQPPEVKLSDTHTMCCFLSKDDEAQAAE